MKDDCITKISRFAKDYRLEPVRTPRQIYDATGYADYHSQITQEDIELSLRRDVSLIDDWLAFTEDKRWIPAWGLSMRSKTEWLLFQTTKENSDYEVYFSSAVSACALIIRFEMEDLRCRRP